MKIRCKLLIFFVAAMVFILFEPVKSSYAADDFYDLNNFNVVTLDEDSDGEFTLEDIWKFLKGIPDAIVSFFSGFYSLVASVRNLILVVFPFFPPVFVDILILLLLLFLFIAIYRMIQGWFG